MMPFAVVEIVSRVIAQTVLIPEFGGHFVQRVLQFVPAGIRRDEPCPSSTLFCKRAEDVHVYRIEILASRPSRKLPSSRPRQRNRECRHSHARNWRGRGTAASRNSGR